MNYHKQPFPCSCMLLELACSHSPFKGNKTSDKPIYSHDSNVSWHGIRLYEGIRASTELIPELNGSGKFFNYPKCIKDVGDHEIPIQWPSADNAQPTTDSIAVSRKMAIDTELKRSVGLPKRLLPLKWTVHELMAIMTEMASCKSQTAVLDLCA